MCVEHVGRMEMSVLNDNTRRLDRKMQNLRIGRICSFSSHYSELACLKSV